MAIQHGSAAGDDDSAAGDDGSAAGGVDYAGKLNCRELTMQKAKLQGVMPAKIADAVLVVVS